MGVAQSGQTPSMVGEKREINKPSTANQYMLIFMKDYQGCVKGLEIESSMPYLPADRVWHEKAGSCD